MGLSLYQLRQKPQIKKIMGLKKVIRYYFTERY